MYTYLGSVSLVIYVNRAVQFFAYLLFDAKIETICQLYKSVNSMRKLAIYL